MNAALRQARNFIVSLKLTIVLLALGIILVFCATLAQVDLGIWVVQKEFFHSFVAIWHVGALYIPMPGGYLVGGLLIVNLIAAHIYRFKFTWSKAGIQLTHIGLILLLVGELLSGLWQEDANMEITEGQTKNYTESYRDHELAFVDTTDAQSDEVTAIPAPLLHRGATLQVAKLPFRVVVKEYYPNSRLRLRGPVVDAQLPPSPATMGEGARFVALEAPITYRQDDANMPTAFIELVGPDGSLGTWLVSATLYRAGQDAQGRDLIGRLEAQRFEHAGRTWTVALRPTRAYQPFSLTLLKFSHDRYVGTEIPKNYSSKLRLTTPGGHDDRDVLIYMNNPLRYSGLTFYQASFRGPQTTVLQVVENPSWILPYVACTLMVLGLLSQFGIHLFSFIGKRRAAATAKAAP